jgi:hypothetical protein
LGEEFGIEELLFLWLCSFIPNSNKVLFAFCYWFFISIYWYLVCTSLAVSTRLISSNNAVDWRILHITRQKVRNVRTNGQNICGSSFKDCDPKDEVLWLPLPFESNYFPFASILRYFLTTVFVNFFCLSQKNMFSAWK